MPKNFVGGEAASTKMKIGNKPSTGKGSRNTWLATAGTSARSAGGVSAGASGPALGPAGNTVGVMATAPVIPGTQPKGTKAETYVPAHAMKVGNKPSTTKGSRKGYL